MARSGLIATVIVLVVAAGVGASWTANEMEARARLEARVKALTGGDPERGRAEISARPCGGCHAIPGIGGAGGKVGPSLKGFAGRVYIGGRVNNAPDKLVQWIMDPHSIDPQNVMPPMGIGQAEARDIAAYLYTLQ